MAYSTYRKPKPKRQIPTAYNVYNSSGKLVDRVYWSYEEDTDEVKKSLVNHDGYDSDIKVTKARRK